VNAEQIAASGDFEAKAVPLAGRLTVGLAIMTDAIAINKLMAILFQSMTSPIFVDLPSWLSLG
jgi:hypothetical protein